MAQWLDSSSVEVRVLKNEKGRLSGSPDEVTLLLLSVLKNEKGICFSGSAAARWLISRGCRLNPLNAKDIYTQQSAAILDFFKKIYFLQFKNFNAL